MQSATPEEIQKFREEYEARYSTEAASAARAYLVALTPEQRDFLAKVRAGELRRVSGTDADRIFGKEPSSEAKWARVEAEVTFHLLETFDFDAPEAAEVAEPTDPDMAATARHWIVDKAWWAQLTLFSSPKTPADLDALRAKWAETAVAAEKYREQAAKAAARRRKATAKKKAADPAAVALKVAKDSLRRAEKQLEQSVAMLATYERLAADPMNGRSATTNAQAIDKAKYYVKMRTTKVEQHKAKVAALAPMLHRTT